MIAQLQKLQIFYYIPTHYSSVLLDHHTTTGPVGSLRLESRKLWKLTFFILLQQWFSTTISLRGAKSRPTILLESRTKNVTTSKLTRSALLH